MRLNIPVACNQSIHWIVKQCNTFLLLVVYSSCLMLSCYKYQCENKFACNWDPADMKLERAVGKIEKFDSLGWEALSWKVRNEWSSKIRTKVRSSTKVAKLSIKLEMPISISRLSRNSKTQVSNSRKLSISGETIQLGFSNLNRKFPISTFLASRFFQLPFSNTYRSKHKWTRKWSKLISTKRH